jgi:uncharacterized protein with GYD domain
MATFVMVGRYASASLGAVSAARTEAAKKIVAANGGKITAGYAMLGENDVLLIVDLPSVEAAIKTSVDLARELGISFNTAPAITVEAFDKLVS